MSVSKDMLVKIRSSVVGAATWLEPMEQHLVDAAKHIGALKHVKHLLNLAFTETSQNDSGSRQAEKPTKARAKREKSASNAEDQAGETRDGDELNKSEKVKREKRQPARHSKDELRAKLAATRTVQTKPRQQGQGWKDNVRPPPKVASSRRELIKTGEGALLSPESASADRLGVQRLIDPGASDDEGHRQAVSDDEGHRQAVSDDEGHRQAVSDDEGHRQAVSNPKASNDTEIVLPGVPADTLAFFALSAGVKKLLHQRRALDESQLLKNVLDCIGFGVGFDELDSKDSLRSVIPDLVKVMGGEDRLKQYVQLKGMTAVVYVMLSFYIINDHATSYPEELSSHLRVPLVAVSKLLSESVELRGLFRDTRK
eukprot:TRINITY_DN7299_c0_g1_i1.p1 TRINITY_DN7299_c0_g1~~TRINITY_DN7299_c0_g1_i1.p1  ORF type:complete len:377 (+),score=65.25 TRINITY_DN7299_c0_g1_i1:23-1132(+)